MACLACDHEFEDEEPAYGIIEGSVIGDEFYEYHTASPHALCERCLKRLLGEDDGDDEPPEAA